MSTHRYIDRICLAGAILSLLLMLLFVNGEALGVQPASRVLGYEGRLFDTARVHTIDIVMDGWDDFIETCENEEYAACSVVIDGEAYKNVGIRAKGNTSLSTVSAMGSDRYSFKIEFDQYDGGKTYHGLDKLCLNNIIQDNTYMKDYLTYQMMGAFGVNAPLCSYAFITVNGQDWGLYLAVEGVEDSFLQRNYGREHGELYKPDSMDFGGGRGNGRDFVMEDIGGQEGFQPAGLPEGGSFSPPSLPEEGASAPPAPPEDAAAAYSGGPGRGGGFGGMGSSDVKLQYTDDDPDSYSNIFSNAKTDISEGDQVRLIQALKALNGGTEIPNAVDVEKVLRYFVVHNYVVNGDSYTGSMVHNYYLYEGEGRLSMIPWDYNLAFGTFRVGDAAGAVNDPIDTPQSVTGNGDRPMADWICASEAYTELYHQFFKEFLETVDPVSIIEQAQELIALYVARDPSKFCTYEEFETGVEALKAFCRLRTQSVSGQLEGSIPSTAEGQNAQGTALVDVSGLSLSDMGSMEGMGGRGGPGQQEGDRMRGGPREMQAPGQPPDSSQTTDPGQAAVIALPERAEGPGTFPGEGKGEVPPTLDGQALWPLGISIFVLLAGILAAAAYRRERACAWK